MPFRHVTVVNVDGRVRDLTLAQFSLQQSGACLPGARRLLLSPEKPSLLHESIEHITIKPLDYFQYSLFVTYVLHRFVQTEFALIVQDDGWVVGGENLNHDFFNYDCLGAPSHFARVGPGRRLL